MQYAFLKDSIRRLVLKGQIDSEIFADFVVPQKDKFILESNTDAFSDILQFLDEPNDKIFILNGYMGSGKSTIINVLPSGLKNDVLVFKSCYFEATNLDDVLLSFFTDFTNYHNEKRITLPKVESTIFSDKINAFIKALNHPMLFIFDSFDVFASPNANQKDILNFIGYLSKFDKIKIIIGSRALDEEDLPQVEGVKTSRVSLLDSARFNELLVLNNIKENTFYIEQMFKHTNGHCLYASMVINLVGLLNISLTNLSAEYTKRNSTFSEFLIFKILGLLPDKFLKLLWFLATIRHGVSESFILSEKFASKDDIEHLKSRLVLVQESGLIFLKNYIKMELIKSIEPETHAKIHKYLSDLYDSQLPKKPSERDLLISRATMRQEMAFHNNYTDSSKLPPQQAGHSEKMGYNYFSYSRKINHDWNFEESSIAPKADNKTTSKQQETSIRKEKNKRFELSKEELLLLNSSNDNGPFDNKDIEYDFAQNNIEQELKKEVVEKKIETLKTPPNSLDEFVQAAQEFEENFNFKSAIQNYEKALKKSDDALFDVKKPLIITKLAICYKKMQDTDEAIRYFEQVYNIYAETEPVKANYILLSIAQIYNETYKFSSAKSAYEKILKTPVENPPSLLVRVLLDLAEIEDNNSNVEKAIDYCKKALIESEKIDDLMLQGEACFKYGLFSDDIGDVDSAFKFYQKCIDVSKEPEVNIYLSSAYSNIAGICSEQNNSQMAIDYYEKAIEVDKNQNNYEGLYFGYSKLAHLLQSQSPNLALESLVKALGAARRLDDNFYAASVYLDLGDFYYNRKLDSKALKAYFQAKKLIMKQPNEENMQKVNTRIKDLKVRLGNTKFLQLISEFQKK